MFVYSVMGVAKAENSSYPVHPPLTLLGGEAGRSGKSSL